MERVYARPQEYDGVGLTLATWLFAFQVYCDFRGYTDIARGAAQTMGYNLMQNFDRPYFATSISDFWKRWHISLTSWLTDYIYTPLTRQRKFKLKLYYVMLGSLLVTFLVSGFWHGAQWTFVAWGALHGGALAVDGGHPRGVLGHLVADDGDGRERERARLPVAGFFAHGAARRAPQPHCGVSGRGDDTEADDSSGPSAHAGILRDLARRVC